MEWLILSVLSGHWIKLYRENVFILINESDYSKQHSKDAPSASMYQNRSELICLKISGAFFNHLSWGVGIT